MAFSDPGFIERRDVLYGLRIARNRLGGRLGDGGCGGGCLWRNSSIAAVVDANGDNLPVLAFLRPQQRHHFIAAIAQLSAKRSAVELPFLLLTALSRGLNALLVLRHVRGTSTSRNSAG